MNGHGNFYVCALPFPSEAPTEQDAQRLALIASAPPLLAALQRLVELHTEHTKMGGTGFYEVADATGIVFEPEDFEQIYAAIALATGGEGE